MLDMIRKFTVPKQLNMLAIVVYFEVSLRDYVNQCKQNRRPLLVIEEIKPQYHKDVEKYLYDYKAAILPNSLIRREILKELFLAGEFGIDPKLPDYTMLVPDSKVKDLVIRMMFELLPPSPIFVKPQTLAKALGEDIFFVNLKTGEQRMASPEEESLPMNPYLH